VLESVGRFGFVLHSPADAPGVEAVPLTRLLRAISAEALGAGLTFVQAMPEGGADVDALTGAGYVELAELVYLRRDLPWLVPAAEPDDVEWRALAQVGEAQLAAVIEGTYAGSLDCPLLCGARAMPDVLDAHRAAGVFTPETWWVVYVDARAAGCILMNESLSSAAAEIVYLGVLPEFRGRGLTRRMLRRAAAAADAAGRVALTVAVDGRNHFAMRVYGETGFIETGRRQAYATFGSRPADTLAPHTCA
jgi:ribosomal protein S18 acetylase RimI-like enzyme